MKKFLLLLVLLFPIKVIAYNPSAESYIVMDQDSKRILAGKNYSKKMLIASTTKIMTALVVIENVNISDKIYVKEEVLQAIGSSIYLSIGETITVKDLLYGLLLRSGNDAALELALHTAKDMKSFANLMNKKAKELKMFNTNFINSSGLEENKVGNISTSYDMALLMSNALDNKILRSIIGTSKYETSTNLKKYVWFNKNKLLTNYEYCTGGKTGFTKLANRTLVTSASKNNVNLVIVTLNDGNDFMDHKNLYETFFKQYKSYTLLDPKNYDLPNNYYLKNGYNLALNEREKDDLVISNVMKENTGYVNIYLGDNLIHKEQIYYKDNISFLKRISNFFKNLFGDLNG